MTMRTDDLQTNLQTHHALQLCYLCSLNLQHIRCPAVWLIKWLLAIEAIIFGLQAVPLAVQHDL